MIFYHSEVIYYLSVDWLFITIYHSLVSLSILVPTLVSVAFFTLAERKIIASIQRRKGPNVVGM